MCSLLLLPFKANLRPGSNVVELVRNLVAHGDAREGKWRGNWRMEWVASNFTPPPNVVYPALFKLTRTPRLPSVDWTEAHTDLNGLVRFGERRNLFSARVPSRSARAIKYIYPAVLILYDFLKWTRTNLSFNFVLRWRLEEPDWGLNFMGFCCPRFSASCEYYCPARLLVGRFHPFIGHEGPWGE